MQYKNVVQSSSAVALIISPTMIYRTLGVLAGVKRENSSRLVIAAYNRAA